MLETSGDRYISFCNIQCDENADKFMAILIQHLKAKHGNPLWQDYFWQKIEEQQRIQRDNLHFIGNQTNPLYEYMEECDDQQAIDLLYKIEQECC
ncbi:N(2)-fixation sustaining protein CowN [Agarivorans aestuarii]|uniref:N(2)-fixation sustaining protein CowN n=1 Tax=Agarivorans aestuarii TaxID=1563703 RepID=A0ABU7G1U3_9ALTE|nr:N(2)-fixation sustaining protein CowN [Agarivorans aestuarii]MEE1673217.1 N(2)-fixation sustaining protein CowN [Agarivorans aestuarii]